MAFWNIRMFMVTAHWVTFATDSPKTIKICPWAGFWTYCICSHMHAARAAAKNDTSWAVLRRTIYCPCDNTTIHEQQTAIWKLVRWCYYYFFSYARAPHTMDTSGWWAVVFVHAVPMASAMIKYDISVSVSAGTKAVLHLSILIVCIPMYVFRLLFELSFYC